jgi:RNA polymerase sigma-70 factor (ECF subfamily)
MTDQPNRDLRDRARRALERSLRSAPPPTDEPPDPELLARLEAALQKLPRRRREIFLAVRKGDSSYAEIAERTGLSAKRVEREFARAMLQLHRASYDPRPEPWWRRFGGHLLRR